MPFTLAHPALVVPLWGRGLPMTALVAGSMVPDAPQMVGILRARPWSHSAVGVVTIDLAMGMLALLLWYAVFRRPLVDLAPDPWRARLPERVAMTSRTWLLCVPAVVVGAATHVGLDAFTHENGWGTARVGLLRTSLLGVDGYAWAQHVCSVIGLAVVALAVRHHLAGLPAQPPKGRPLVGRWTLVVALAWGGLLGLGIAALVTPWGLEAVAYYGVVTTMLVAGSGAACVCLWWQVKRRLRRSEPADAG